MLPRLPTCPPRAVGGLGGRRTCLSALGQREKGAASTEGWARRGGTQGQGTPGAAAGEERKGGVQEKRGGQSPEAQTPKCPQELDLKADTSNSFP